MIGPDGVQQAGPLGERRQRRLVALGGQQDERMRVERDRDDRPATGRPVRAPAAIRAACPRWTPSKLPTATTPPRTAAGGSSWSRSGTTAMPPPNSCKGIACPSL